MGATSCKFHKKAASKQLVLPNGSLESLAKQSGGPPLDQRQIFRLKQSWKGIRRRLMETGIEMFVRLFRKNAELKLFFKNFSDINGEDELRDSELLAEHATLVMQRIDDCITHIDNQEYVTQVITATRQFHINKDGYSHKFFWKVKEPFLEAVKITLEDRYTDSMEIIYVAAINFLLTSLSGGLREDDGSLSEDELRKQIEEFQIHLHSLDSHTGVSEIHIQQ